MKEFKCQMKRPITKDSDSINYFTKLVWHNIGMIGDAVKKSEMDRILPETERDGSVCKYKEQ